LKAAATGEKLKAPAQVSSTIANKPVSNSKVATGWYAQVGAPERLADAESVARRLRSQGYPVVIENAQVRGAVYYRVLVGKSSSKEQASAMLGRLQREKSLPAKPFVKYMK
jgi:cell division septation protein DedD